MMMERAARKGSVVLRKRRAQQVSCCALFLSSKSAVQRRTEKMGEPCMKKRILSLLLALVLVLGLMPGAMAAENEPEAEEALLSAAEIPEETPAQAQEEPIDPVQEEPVLPAEDEAAPQAQNEAEQAAAADAPEGDGSRDNPYQLGDAAALFWFAQAVNGGQAELCAVLTNDVDLAGADWTPIGNLSKRFKGTFDGNGYTVKDLKVSGQENAGLFGYAEDATIQNVIVQGSVSGTSSAGGVAGYIRGQTRILNCGNEASVTCSGNYAGGIAGQAGVYGSVNTISGCYNTADVTAEGTGSRAGGILGYDGGAAVLSDCYNTGDVQAVSYAAGIRAVNSTSNGSISSCYSLGSCTAKSMGAIAPGGGYQSAEGTSCYAQKDGKLVNDQTGETLSKTELLAALNGEGTVWKQDDTVNGGYPVLSWQSVAAPEGELVLAENVEFSRELVDTADGEQMSVPTSVLTWDEVSGATGYVIALWRQSYGWRELTAEERKAYTNPEAGASYTDLLMGIDESAILEYFTATQNQQLLKLQQTLAEKQQEMNAALQERADASSKEDYNAKNAAYHEAVEAYNAAYEAYSKFIIEQAVACDYPLGWQESGISRVRMMKTGSKASYDCAQELLELGDGVYYATVSAVDENGGYSLPEPEYVDADVVGWQEPYTRMQAITNLHWDGTTACWDGKEYFTAAQRYRIDLYEVEDGNYTFFETFEIEGNFSKASFRGVFAAQRSYAFTVTALTDTELLVRCGLTDSLPSGYSPVYAPDTSGDDDWIAISTAEEWMKLANVEDVPSDPEDGNSPSEQEIAWSKNYYLADDIDFSTLSAEDRTRTKSIGTKTYMFQGKFNGNGKKITGLTLSGSDSGLFWYAGNLSEIYDVTIVNPNVYLSDNAAVLVHNNYGIIKHCAVIGCNITADLGGVMGGMVSRNYGVIRESYVQGGKLDSHSTSSTGHAGFVGANENGGLIERCWTSMDVNTTSDYAGGFVGLGYNGTIRDCVSFGNVHARGYSGGFVGRSVYESNVYENCYAAGVVSCTEAEGHGFIGGNRPDSNFQYDQTNGIRNCYYNQASEAADSNYGAAGMTLDTMQSASFAKALGENWRQDDEKNNGLPYPLGVTVPAELETSEITVSIELVRYNRETYSYERLRAPFDVTLTSNGNTLVTDVMDAAVKQGNFSYGYAVTGYGRYISVIDGYEVLEPDGWMFTIDGELSNFGASTATVGNGSRIVWYEGTTQNHYAQPNMDALDDSSGYWTQIRTAAQLHELAAATDAETLSGNYKLAADINLRGDEFDGIGSPDAPFTGVFDGNGKTISNLTISKAGEDSVGLFRVILGGTVKNLTLKNVSVSGGSHVGAVVGQAQVALNTTQMSGSIAGLIGNVHVTGSVSGAEQTGGTVGLNGGAQDSKTDFSVANAVDRCTFEGTVTGETITGGLVGRNDGTVTASSADGTVEAGATGRMAGGLVGQNEGSIYTSWADGKVHGKAYVGGFVGSGSGSVKQCYSLGNVSGADYVGGFAGAIGTVETAISAGKVTVSGVQDQGYVGGFAGNLGGTIVGAPGSITVKNVFGYCKKDDGTLLPAAGRTDSAASDGLKAALEGMRLNTPGEAKEKLHSIFGINYTRFDDDLKQAQADAAALEKKIKKLPADTKLKLTDRDTVQEVKAAYDALSADAKLFVSEDALSRLNACLAKIAQLEQESAAAIAKAEEFKTCMALVPAQSAQIKASDEENIKAARAAYNQITDKDLLKTLKTLYKQLTAAEKALTKNRTAAQKVQTQIDALPDTLANLALSMRKTVDKAQKAYEKLTDGQKTFLKEGSEKKLSDCSRRMNILMGNESLIKAAEKACKSVPTAERVRKTDSEKLQRAKAAIDAVTAQEELLQQEDDLKDIVLTISNRARYDEAQAAYTRYEEEANAYRTAHLAKLPASQNVALSDADTITNARTAYKALSRNAQSFIDKTELSNLTACEKQLKKVQSQDKKDRSAAAKVETQIYRLPNVQAGQAVTERNRKAITAARSAYEKLNQKQYVSEQALSYLEACEAALAAL